MSDAGSGNPRSSRTLIDEGDIWVYAHRDGRAPNGWQALRDPDPSAAPMVA